MTFPRLPKAIGWRDHAIGAALGLAYLVWLLATARSLGFPRDEGFYFHAGWDYARWFKVLFASPSSAFDRSTVDSMWSYNHEHPSLMKALFGLSWMFFWEKWKVFADQSTAFRLPAMAMGAIAVWVTYLFGARAYSRRAGAVAAVSLALMPHVFFHAHLACFDVPIMTMWTLCIYVYWRSQVERGLGWAIATGIVFGLTLETKHNAWVLPAVFLPHALLVHGRAMLSGLRVGRVPIPASLVAMATLGPAVFVAFWPWMWNDTIPRIQEYVNFHLHHEYYNIEFLHKNYFGPPSPKAYAPVMILATVPTVTLALFAVGAWDRIVVALRRLYGAATRAVGRTLPPAIDGWLARPNETGAPRDHAETDLLIALAFAAAVSPFFLPSTPIFGGTKHWITAYPFLAILAGRGFDLVASAMERALSQATEGRRTLAQACLAGSVVLGPLAVTVHSHPFGLGAYVPLVGGTAGGADMGLYRSFWGYTTQNLAPYFASLPPGTSVYIHDTAWDSWARMQDENRIRPDLRGVGSPSEASVSIVHYELHMLESEYQIWTTAGTVRPDYVLTHDGVPFVGVYKKK